MSTGRSRTQNDVSPRFLRIGVTGGIGSGKTTVCREFERLGRKVLCADTIAREIAEGDEDTKSEIRSLLGPHVFAPDGKLQRREVAALVFQDAVKRQRLQSILHPRVFSRIDSLLSVHDPAFVPYVVIEAALIFETNMDRRLDYTIVVDAPEPVRRDRVMARDAVTRDEVQARMDAQMKVREKRLLADFVIENQGSASDLAMKVAFLDTLFGAIALPSSPG